MNCKKSSLHTVLSTENTILAVALLMGFLVRVFVLGRVYVINTDSIFYIFQAQAISQGMWDAPKSCGWGFVSIYPFLVVLFNKVFDDWILSGQMVSLTFGTLTIVPLFFLLRRFVPGRIAGLAALTFALNPFFVKESVDVMKDPVYWFFAALGMAFLVKGLAEKRNLLLLASSLSLLFSALARVEGMFFFAGSLLFLIFRKERSIRGILSFGAPLIVGAVATSVGVLIATGGVSLWETYVVPRYMDISRRHFFYNPFDSHITAALTEIDSRSLAAFPQNFFTYVKMNLWLVALGVLLSKTLSAAYPPFVAFYVLGLRGIGDELKAKPLLRYLLLVSAVSFVFLYLHTFLIWVMERRYTVSFLFPLFFLLALGLRRAWDFLKGRGLSDAWALAIILAVIVGSTVPGNVKTVRKDKLPYRQAGEYVRSRMAGGEAKIATSSVWVTFYASLPNKRLRCPVPELDYGKLALMEYGELVSLLRQGGVRYYLWEEDRWKHAPYDFLSAVDPADMVRVGEWRVREERLVLFEVVGQ